MLLSGLLALRTHAVPRCAYGTLVLQHIKQQHRTLSDCAFVLFCLQCHPPAARSLSGLTPRTCSSSPLRFLAAPVRSNYCAAQPVNTCVYTPAARSLSGLTPRTRSDCRRSVGSAGALGSGRDLRVGRRQNPRISNCADTPFCSTDVRHTHMQYICTDVRGCRARNVSAGWSPRAHLYLTLMPCRSLLMQASAACLCDPRSVQAAPVQAAACATSTMHLLPLLMPFCGMSPALPLQPLH